MGLIDEFNGIGDNHALVFSCVIALLAPGIGAILVFEPSILKDLDIFKILLISGGFGFLSALPLFMTLVTTYVARISKSNGTKDLVFSSLLISAAIVLLVAFLLQFTFYLFNWNSLKFYLLVHVILVFILLPTVCYRLFKNGANSKSTS